MLEGRSPTQGRRSASSLEWGSQSALRWGPARVTLLGQWPRGWKPGPLLPGCSLLGAALSALGRTAVVPDEAAKAHGHGPVTVVHGHHSHLLSRRPMGQAQAANVGLLEETVQETSACSPTTALGRLTSPGTCPAHGGGAHGRAACGPGARRQPPASFYISPSNQLYWENSIPPKFLSSLEPRNGTLFRTRGPAKCNSLRGCHTTVGRALMPCDWCPYKKTDAEAETHRNVM